MFEPDHCQALIADLRLTDRHDANALALAAALTFIATALDPLPEEYPAWNPLEAEVVVLGGVGQPDDTRRLLEALDARGQFIHRRPTLEAGALAHCVALSEEFEPTPNPHIYVQDSITPAPTSPAPSAMPYWRASERPWARVDGPESQRTPNP